MFIGVISFASILSAKVLDGNLVGEFRDNHSVWKPYFNSFGLWANLPTLFLAYGFHATYFPVFVNLKEKTDVNGMKSAVYSVFCCFSIYVIIGIVGMIAYGSDIQGDIMKNIS